MTKSRGIEWLESETGQSLERVPLSGDDGRHLSLRIPVVLFDQLERLAAQRDETVSQVARRLLGEGVARITNPDRAALDTAIEILERARARGGGSAA